MLCNGKYQILIKKENLTTLAALATLTALATTTVLATLTTLAEKCQSF